MSGPGRCAASGSCYQRITDQDVTVAAAAKTLNRGAFEDGVWLVGQVAGLNS